jgi:superfamily II DNA/RNA helicase
MARSHHDLELTSQVDSFDFKDPKYLSTSNPRWLEAGLAQSVIDVLSGKGITHFTPVQGEAFDPIVAGRDLIARSRTGTGKTLAFALPCITRLNSWVDEQGYRDASGRFVRGRPVSMIVLCPTRELARQVQDEISAVASPLGLYTDVFHGGVSYDPQVSIACSDTLSHFRF